MWKLKVTGAMLYFSCDITTKMIVTIKLETNIDVQSTIRLLPDKSKNPTEVHCKLFDFYSQHIMSLVLVLYVYGIYNSAGWTLYRVFMFNYFK